jgi:hypothetical protein
MFANVGLALTPVRLGEARNGPVIQQVKGVDSIQ